MALWDTGTGAHTMLRQVVAEELTVPVEDVRVAVQNTDAVAFDSGSGGSRVTYTAGQTVLGAARDLKAKLVQRAAGLYETGENSITLTGGSFQIQDSPVRTIPLKDMVSRAVADREAAIVGEFTFSGTASPVTSFCTQIAEVDVDTETGQVRVERIVTSHDVGTIINPLTHQGQIEGGVIQGLGYALMEELGTEEGRISTLTLGDYKLPTMPDIPKLETVLLESPSGPAPYQSKGIGESSNVPIAGAIANAVYDAVGVRIIDLPITAEKVLRALKEKEADG
jgi:CO/xanthine dehydrogenase Mo-binding subunit